MPRFIIEETSPHIVACRRIVEAEDETQALAAFRRGEGAKVEGYPEIGEQVPDGKKQRVVARTDDTVSVQLTSRELTLIRAACIGRLERIVSKADTADLVQSYEETKALLDGKLKAARRNLFKKTGER